MCYHADLQWVTMTSRISSRTVVIWSHQGSIAQSRDTCATIKRALEAGDTKYAGKTFEVFRQGSYGNDTNIYAESDVDIVIRLDDIYYHDTNDLNPQELAQFNAGFMPATYSYDEFKTGRKSVA